MFDDEGMVGMEGEGDEDEDEVVEEEEECGGLVLLLVGLLLACEERKRVKKLPGIVGPLGEVCAVCVCVGVYVYAT